MYLTIQMGEYLLNNLKSTLLGAVFLAGMSTLMTANAADVYSRGSIKDSGPVDYRPAIGWTGFYIGGHAGSTFDDTASLDIDDRELDALFGGDVEVDEVGIAGIHLGYNWQTARNLVLGIEGSVTFPFDSDDFGADYLATIRGRLGYAFGNTLIYGTGGIAFASVEDEFSDDTETGWVAGLGIEHKLRDNLSLGLEGLYYSFEDDDSIDGIDIEAERDFWTIQARITYHFGDRHADPLK